MLRILIDILETLYQFAMVAISQVVDHQLSGQNVSAPLGAKNTTELTEVVTPRGVSVKKSQVYDSGQVGEGTDQPSPVSVLDNAIFEEEECTPSPRAKTLAINFQGSHSYLEFTDENKMVGCFLRLIV